MLNLYEAALQKCFDVKLRGRLGEHADDLKEIRVLNRILRITAKGLTYEADPRHVELLSRSLGLEGTRLITTPGVKWRDQPDGAPSQEEQAVDEDEDADPFATVNFIQTPNAVRIKLVKRNGVEIKIRQEVQFSDVVEQHEIQPYSEVYQRPLNTFVLNGAISNQSMKHIREIPESYDSFNCQPKA